VYRIHSKMWGYCRKTWSEALCKNALKVSSKEIPSNFRKTRYSSGIRRAECIQEVNSAAVWVGQISTKVPF
jgi:hypothetical protein